MVRGKKEVGGRPHGERRAQCHSLMEISPPPLSPLSRRRAMLYENVLPESCMSMSKLNREC